MQHLIRNTAGGFTVHFENRTAQERIAKFLDERLRGYVSCSRPGLVLEIALGNPLPPDRLTKCVHRVIVEMAWSVDEFQVRDEYATRLRKKVGANHE